MSKNFQAAAGLAWWLADDTGMCFPGKTAFDAGQHASQHLKQSWNTLTWVLAWDTKLRPEDVYAQGEVVRSRSYVEVNEFKEAGDALGSFIGRESAARIRESVARKRGRKDKKKKRWGFG